MKNPILVCAFVATWSGAVWANDPKPRVRPITEADSVLAVYREDWGLFSDGSPALIFVAWPDGHVVWSADRLQGGPPYRTADIDPRKVTTLLASFGKDGLFADKNLNRAYWGPDSEFIKVYIKSGKNEVEMESWHELVEVRGDVATSAGARLLNMEKFLRSSKGKAATTAPRATPPIVRHFIYAPNQGTHRPLVTFDDDRRLAILRKEPADYLYFRFVWSETRGKLADLIPSDSKPSKGKPEMKAGVLTWQEELNPARSPEPRNGPRKTK
jgi:hypothetical protein